jgi:hypothetical protein
MFQNILQSPLAGIIILIVLLVLLAFLVWGVWQLLFGAYAIEDAKEIECPNDQTFLSVAPNIVCAAADLSGPETEVERELEQCVAHAREGLHEIQEIREAFSLFDTWEVLHSDGQVTSYDRSEVAELCRHLFCVGDSLAGIGIPPTSILTVFKIDGGALDAGIGSWRKIENNRLSTEAIVEFNGYTVNLAEDTITLPNGFLVQRGDVIALDMSDEAKNRYFEKLTEADGTARVDDATSRLLLKGRIFGGLKITSEGLLEIICYRHPKGCDHAIIGGKTHALHKLCGYVLDVNSLEKARALLDASRRNDQAA